MSHETDHLRCIKHSQLLKMNQGTSRKFELDQTSRSLYLLCKSRMCHILMDSPHPISLWNISHSPLKSCSHGPSPWQPGTCASCPYQTGGKKTEEIRWKEIASKWRRGGATCLSLFNMCLLIPAAFITHKLMLVTLFLLCVLYPIPKGFGNCPVLLRTAWLLEKVRGCTKYSLHCA